MVTGRSRSLNRNAIFAVIFRNVTLIYVNLRKKRQSKEKKKFPEKNVIFKFYLFLPKLTLFHRFDETIAIIKNNFVGHVMLGIILQVCIIT